MVSWVKGQVVNKRRWTPQLYSLQIDAPVNQFRAGQFTKLSLDDSGQHTGRPYSYVNPPGRQPLEFYFIIVPDGPLSHRLAELESGDEIWVMQQAAGFFTLDELPDAEDLWLLSTGTAIGPFLSILGTPTPWRRFRNIVLVHAVRNVEELTYRDTLEEISAAHSDRFRVIPFVSREDTDFALTGRIPEAIADGRLEQRAGLSLDPARSQVMICGNPEMVHDTTQSLIGRGLRKNRRREPGHITTEKYW
jgi:ferredoxin--NADP+ reductase